MSGFRITTPLNNITTAVLYGLSTSSSSGNGKTKNGPKGSQGISGQEGFFGLSSMLGFQGVQGFTGTTAGFQGSQGYFNGIMNTNITMDSPILTLGTQSIPLQDLYVNGIQPFGADIYVNSNIIPIPGKYGLSWSYWI